MYVGIDIGGTKTLLACLDDQGVITQQQRFPTPKEYSTFLEKLAEGLKTFPRQGFKAGGVGVPGHIDQARGVSLGSAHVTWADVPLKADCEKIFNCPFVIDNDANLAGLSEAMLHKDYATVLYFTVSTGIGTGFIRNQRIEPALIKSEGGHIKLPYEGKLEVWENFAAGKAIYEHFGKKASEITDKADWQFIARNLSLGFFDNIAILQPDLIVVGGSIGAYFDRYGEYLIAELKRYETSLVPIPPVVKAQRPDSAVLYGCYDLAKQVHGRGQADS